jgi:hypothetical protein
MWGELLDYGVMGSLICGVLAYFIAKYKGRNPWFWFGIGTIGSLVGLLIVIFIKIKIIKK